MLQIDHIYEFLYQEIFKDFDFWHLFNGVPSINPTTIYDISVFTPGIHTTKKIFFYDQEPIITKLFHPYMKLFSWETNYTVTELVDMNNTNLLPMEITPLNEEDILFLQNTPESIFKKRILVISE